jgi:anti-sigma B factor antagonist
MLDIQVSETKEIFLKGRFDASQVDTAREVFEKIATTTPVNFQELEYISSAGLGVLLSTQKRLKGKGHELVLRQMNKHIREIFSYAGFDMIFKIED